jgi:hypothetical protein
LSLSLSLSLSFYFSYSWSTSLGKRGGEYKDNSSSLYFLYYD